MYGNMGACSRRADVPIASALSLAGILLTALQASLAAGAIGNAA